MRQNQPDTRHSTAQPVVASVPYPDDESDVIRVGTAPSVRLSLISNPQSPIPIH